MIKARYLGVDNQLLQHGKLYPLKTHCVLWEGKPSLRVRFGESFCYWVHYTSLESFLKSWKVEVVYHGKSRAKKG